jgi:hypothetical protein
MIMQRYHVVQVELEPGDDRVAVTMALIESPEGEVDETGSWAQTHTFYTEEPREYWAGRVFVMQPVTTLGSADPTRVTARSATSPAWTGVSGVNHRGEPECTDMSHVAASNAGIGVAGDASGGSHSS